MKRQHRKPQTPKPPASAPEPTPALTRAALRSIAALKPTFDAASDYKPLAALAIEIARQALEREPLDVRDRLTREQKQRYFENGTTLCPFCQSPDILGGSVEVESQFAWQEVTCSACGQEWQDLYTQHDVDSIDYTAKGQAHVAS